MIDRFHSDNHTCGTTQKLDTYPYLCSINSQVNEQANAYLKRLRSQFSYMKPVNFMVHLRLYLYNHNAEKKAELAKKQLL